MKRRHQRAKMPLTVYRGLNACAPLCKRLMARSIVSVLAAAATVAAVATALLVAHSLRESAERAQCARHLAIIGQAMYAYYQDYGRFPPAYLAGPDGKPAHSWRVLLLPYLEGAKIYSQYRFDEPWNGPHNQGIASKLHRIRGCPIYSCPSDKATWGACETNYVVVTGRGTMFDGAESVTVSDVLDGPHSTLMLVEVTGTQIHWMQPRDLDLAAMDFSVGASTGNNISSLHHCGAHVVFADLTKHSLSAAACEDDIRRMSSIAAGDPLVPSRMMIFDTYEQ